MYLLVIALLSFLLVLMYIRKEKRSDLDSHKKKCTILHHWHETCQAQAVVYWVEGDLLRLKTEGSWFVVIHNSDLARAARGLTKVLLVQTAQPGVYQAVLVGTESFVLVFAVEDASDSRLDFVCQQHQLLPFTGYCKPVSLRMHRIKENDNFQLVLFTRYNK